MRFIDVSGFCVRLDRQTEFAQWVIDNEERIKQSYPEGSSFGGIYAAVFSTDKDGGEWYWLDILDSYGALDHSAAAAKDPTSELSKIETEFLAFIDPDRRAGWSRHILKSVLDVTVKDVPVA